MSYRWTYVENEIFKGKHDDFDTIWYSTIGVTILITLGINIFSYPISEMISNILRLFS